MDIDPDGLARYHQFTEDYRQQCREKRAREAAWQCELDELAKPRVSESATKSEVVCKTDGVNYAGGIVHKTHTSESGEQTKSVTVTPPKVAPNETVAWWQWTQDHVRHQVSEQEKSARKHVQQHVRQAIEEFMAMYRDVMGQVIASERKDMRAHVAGAVDPIKADLERAGERMAEERERREQEDAVTRYEIGVVRRELTALREETAREVEQLRSAVDLRAEYLLAAKELREQVASAQAAQAQGREDLLQREVAVLREQVGREQELNAREIEQLQDAVDMRAELQLGIKELRDRDASAQAELLQREVAALREQIGLQRELESLRAKVATARAEIPSVPAVVEQIHGEHAELKREQTRLERELAKQKDRLGKLRVDQSVTDYSLKKLESAQQPVVELKFVTEDGCCFSLKDAHPDAIETWRRFAHELVAANDGVMFPSDPNNMISMPVPARKVGAA